MSTYVGLVVVLASVAGGFAMANGHFGILVQPNELVVIGGAAVGSLFIAAPGKVLGRVRRALKRGFSVHLPTKGDYLQLLRLLNALFQLVRREGVLALEKHLEKPAQSPVLGKYPAVRKHPEAMAFLLESLRLMVDGCATGDLLALLDADLDTHHEQEKQPIDLLRTTGDALPGLGIVAAVLGVIITMGHLDGGPEEIGHHIAAALVGTFLGILLCYGFLGPLSTSLEVQAGAEARFLLCIREGLAALARGAPPSVAVEFARRSIFHDERPSLVELEKALAADKGDPGAKAAPAKAA